MSNTRYIEFVLQIVESDEKQSSESESIDEYREYHDGANFTPPVSCAVPNTVSAPDSDRGTLADVPDVKKEPQPSEHTLVASKKETDEDVANDNGYESSL